MDDQAKEKLIICPLCKAEYLPAEIFIPNAFFGTPYAIDKDDNGKIIDYSGTSLDMKEKYTCDYCNTTFNISASIKLRTYVSKEDSFEEVYYAPLFQPTFELEEE